MKLVDIQFIEAANEIQQNEVVLPTMAGIGDLGCVTTTLIEGCFVGPVPVIGRFELQKRRAVPDNNALIVPGGTRDIKVAALYDTACAGVRPHNVIHLGSTLSNAPAMPLTTYSASFIYNPGTNQPGSMSVCDFAQGVRGTRRWGIQQSLNLIPFTPNFGVNQYGPWGGSATIVGGGPFKFEIQVNSTLNPKVVVRIYRVSDNSLRARFTTNPANVACDVLQFGDVGALTAFTGQQHYWSDFEVWNTYDADGAWAGAGVPANNATFVGSGIRSTYTLPSSYRGSNDTPPAVYTAWEGSNHLRYGSETNAHRINLYIPNRRPANPDGFPLVIWVHGGYFITGDKINMPINWRNELLAAGYAVASIRYVKSTLKIAAEGAYLPWGTSDQYSSNLPGYGRFPSWICDAKLAAVRLRDRYSQSGTGPKLNNKNFGFDPNRIFIAGHSAGGFISVGAACTRDLTNDGPGTGRNLSLAGNPTYAEDEQGNVYIGPDPEFLGCISYAGPTDMQEALVWDKTDELSVNPPNCYTINAFTPGGNFAPRGYICASAHAFKGQIATAANPDLTNTDIPNLIDRTVTDNGASSIPPVYYIRGTADYLIHWEHEEVLANQMAASGLLDRYTSSTTPAPHEIANAVYNPTELLNWLDGLVVESGGIPGIAVTPPPIQSGIPLICLADETPVGWPLDFSAGKLEFVDNNYTIPNRAVRFAQGGTFPLHIASLTGEDITTINGIYSHEQREPVRRAEIECQMLFGVNSAGSVYTGLQEGLTTNWDDLTSLSDLSRTSASGLQTIRYTPYIGGPVHQFSAHVLPPVVGSTQLGVGMSFRLTLEVPNPEPALP
jgi:hypothetical protein